MRVGYACITLDQDGSKNSACAYQGTTVASLRRLSSADCNTKLRTLALNNIRALRNTVERLSVQSEILRMYRITSDLLPLYTHEVAYWVYRDRPFAQEIEDELHGIGEAARAASIRLSTHPGQYTVLNSMKSEQTRLDAISEIEYHTYMATSMGYSGETDGYCINIHGGAKLDSLDRALEGWGWSWPRLSRAAQRLMTVENDEFSWSLGNIIVLAERLGLRVVPDIHHHFVAEGEWLRPESPLMVRARSTWNGLTGKMHVSMPNPAIIGYGSPDRPPQHADPLLPVNQGGASKAAMRAHADYIWHPALVGLLREYSQGWDIMAECKAKNLAAEALANGLGHQKICQPV